MTTLRRTAQARPHPTLFDLSSDQCRFPAGGFGEPVRFFCGTPVQPGGPYCPESCQRAYVTISAGGGFRLKKWGEQ